MLVNYTTLSHPMVFLHLYRWSQSYLSKHRLLCSHFGRVYTDVMYRRMKKQRTLTENTILPILCFVLLENDMGPK